MSKNKTRKSVSINGAMFRQLMEFSAAQGLSMSQVVERGVEMFMATYRKPPDASAPMIDPVPRVKSTTVDLPVSETVEEHVEAAATRLGITPSSVLDTGINRMLDRLERTNLCRGCCQVTTECECP